MMRAASFTLYKLATKNLHLATIFLQLVTSRRPEDFFLFSSPVRICYSHRGGIVWLTCKTKAMYSPVHVGSGIEITGSWPPGIFFWAFFGPVALISLMGQWFISLTSPLPSFQKSQCQAWYLLYLFSIVLLFSLYQYCMHLGPISFWVTWLTCFTIVCTLVVLL